MSSLQDQLMKAGLVDKDKAKKIKKAKHKQQKVAQKSKQVTDDEVKLAAKEAIKAKAEVDRQLNLENKAVLEKKAILAQVKQMILMNRIARTKGDVAYNFVDQGKVKTLYVLPKYQEELSRSLLSIGIVEEPSGRTYHLIPKKAAEKIAERSPEHVVIIEKDTQTPVEDDPYADYQIPDDLMW
ncbi:MAG: DUF2058 domain-containing protein [Cellvibrionales bacterium]|nr:DUF2058 domain-containing protein [Cellvibrionales bacterium]